MQQIPSFQSRALKLSIPALLVYFPLGLVFGLVFTQQGLEWFYAPIMSALVYAGAVQFVALGMITEHASIWAILLTTVFVALRNSFYGLSLLDRFNGRWLTKIFLIFSLVDATYAILLNYKHPENDLKFCVTVAALVYSYWVLGTLVGALFAEQLPKITGLDFILTCFFMILVIDYFMIHRRLKPIVVPVVFSILAYLLLPQYYLLVATLLCVLYLYMNAKVEANG